MNPKDSACPEASLVGERNLEEGAHNIVWWGLKWQLGQG